MQFALARYTEVAVRLSMFWAVVSLAVQSILGRFPLTLSKWVLWVKWLPGSRSEQSGVHILRLLA
jgi:hypothetical protein